MGLKARLIKAIINNDTNAVSTCLAAGADPNGYEDYAKITPLHISVAFKSIGSAQLLLAYGANPLAEDQEGFTPIDEACARQDSEMSALFLAYISNQYRKYLH